MTMKPRAMPKKRPMPGSPAVTPVRKRPTRRDVVGNSQPMPGSFAVTPVRKRPTRRDVVGNSQPMPGGGAVTPVRKKPTLGVPVRKKPTLGVPVRKKPTRGVAPRSSQPTVTPPPNMRQLTRRAEAMRGQPTQGGGAVMPVRKK